LNSLINIKNENGKKAVSARELYKGLGLARTKWTPWYQKNIIENDFFKESKDWEVMSPKVTGPETVDFAISIDFAKHIAMMSRTEKSHEYRNYFIAIEKQIKPQITEKQLLVLDIYEGGIKAIEGHKKLSKIEIDEALKGLKDGNNKIISCTTVVAMLRIEGLTTTLLNKWFCKNGFGEMKRLPHQRNRFFCPNERFEKYVAYEGYSFTGLTTNSNKTKVFYSTSMVDRLTERHMRSIINFVTAERSNC